MKGWLGTQVLTITNFTSLLQHRIGPALYATLSGIVSRVRSMIARVPLHRVFVVIVYGIPLVQREFSVNSGVSSYTRVQ